MKFNTNLIFEKLGMKGFYHFVYLAMVLSLTGSLYSFAITYYLMNFGQFISSIGGLIVTLLFTFLFKYLRDTSPGKLENKELRSTESMIKLM